MATYWVIGDITETSPLHGSPSGRARAIARDFRSARKCLQEWLDSEAERAGETAPRAPRRMCETLTWRDWTYRIIPNQAAYAEYTAENARWEGV